MPLKGFLAKISVLKFASYMVAWTLNTLGFKIYPFKKRSYLFTSGCLKGSIAKAGDAIYYSSPILLIRASYDII